MPIQLSFNVFNNIICILAQQRTLPQAFSPILAFVSHMASGVEKRGGWFFGTFPWDRLALDFFACSMSHVTFFAEISGSKFGLWAL